MAPFQIFYVFFNIATEEEVEMRFPLELVAPPVVVLLEIVENPDRLLQHCFVLEINQSI